MPTRAQFGVAAAVAAAALVVVVVLAVMVAFIPARCNTAAAQGASLAMQLQHATPPPVSEELERWSAAHSVRSADRPLAPPQAQRGRKLWLSCTTSPARLGLLGRLLPPLVRAVATASEEATVPFFGGALLALPPVYRPTGEAYGPLPSALKELQAAGLLRVLQPTSDAGPVTKAAAAGVWLEEQGRVDDVLLYLDGDDTLYSSGLPVLLLNAYTWLLEAGVEAVLTVRPMHARRVGMWQWKQHRPGSPALAALLRQHGAVLEQADVPEGFRSVMVRVGALPWRQMVAAAAVHKALRTSDDVLVAWAAAAVGLPVLGWSGSIEKLTADKATSVPKQHWGVLGWGAAGPPALPTVPSRHCWLQQLAEGYGADALHAQAGGSHGAKYRRAAARLAKDVWPVGGAAPQPAAAWVVEEVEAEEAEAKVA